MLDPNSARALRPLRRLNLPGGRTVLRAGLVAALLGLAAAVLHTPAECPPTAVPSDAPSVADDTGRQVDGSRSAESSRTGVPDIPRSTSAPDESAAEPGRVGPGPPA
ncbi:hypothetical protein ACLQ3D_32145 [Micromonospora vinacea]|uniref:Uncharacterized protein n=1 Tax=Micromonospora vinacea TaxID=709878 RepID=A0ABS0K0K7_9ACTN|nr:hypothetical protein [Micromonospora vinacea]MBG6102153.1 hypothetical protein [Micromonospora vinacea]WTA68464.1 hypothetical protein OHB51_04640 [Micromonospora sp. NBC_00855]